MYSGIWPFVDGNHVPNVWERASFVSYTSHASIKGLTQTLRLAEMRTWMTVELGRSTGGIFEMGWFLNCSVHQRLKRMTVMIDGEKY